MADKQNVVSVSDRIPALKEQRKKRANRRLIFYLSIFFILIGIVVYFQSPLSHVQQIQVEGNYTGETREIIDQSALVSGESIWSQSLSSAKERVEQIPYIEEATIERSLPTTLRIIVQERDRTAYLHSNDQFIPVYGNGQLMDEQSLDTYPSDAPIIFNWQNEELLEAFFVELDKLGSGMINHISEIHPSDDDPTLLRLFMNDGIEVETTIENFASYMAPYPTVARQISEPSDGILHMKMSPYFEAFNPEEYAGEIHEEHIDTGDGGLETEEEPVTEEPIEEGENN
ncbi:cell division protein FtsQ/DivIB [Geomicrobium sediminis]|uniref:Cell division protein DivIB n=1 Tax=Geomicrobium sediminis TaxID=1347788 RepID=A0ABS2PAQ5_9BACL|nr:FtsQ-type POTRA domain-containing protein [Geomicrobium sediminis]MBM7632498.1 cell division protein FtsQ [Geomicrobium sediminis]